jgi:type VI protein secretion system component Hcp
MVTVFRHNPRTVVVMLCAVALAALGVVGRAEPVGGAVPSGTQVGTVTYTHLVGTTDVTQSIRSFSWRAVAADPQTRTVVDDPSVVQGADATAPLFVRTVMGGTHVPSVVVDLFQPGTSKRATEWTFTDALLSLVTDSKTSPANAPTQTVSWSFRTMTETTYKADGSTVSRTYCFDIAQYAGC